WALIPHDHTVPAARRAADLAEHPRHDDVGERLTDLDAHGDETTGLTNGEMVGTPGQPRGAPRIVRPTEAVVREALVEHHDGCLDRRGGSQAHSRRGSIHVDCR